jgi:hypothetical protein
MQIMSAGKYACVPRVRGQANRHIFVKYFDAIAQKPLRKFHQFLLGLKRPNGHAVSCCSALGAAPDQILRLGLTLLNHQTRTAPTTTTYKIISFTWLHLPIGSKNSVLVAPLEFIFGEYILGLVIGRPPCLLQGQSRKAAPSFASVAERFMR